MPRQHDERCQRLAAVQGVGPLGNLEQSLAKHFAQAVTLGFRESLDQQPPRPCDPARRDDAVLGEQTAHLID